MMFANSRPILPLDGKKKRSYSSVSRQRNKMAAECHAHRPRTRSGNGTTPKLAV